RFLSPPERVPFETGTKFQGRPYRTRPHRAKFRQRGSVHADDDGGDVVFTAAGVGDLDEALDGDLPLVREDVRDLVLAQVPVEPVATEKVDVAWLRFPHARVDLDVVAAAHGARDDVSLAARPRFGRRDQPLLDLPGDQRVVLGQ